MTYLLLPAFVFGVWIIIRNFFEFFGFDIDSFYQLDKHGFSRSLWQRFLLKPTIYCAACMSSFWGSVCYWGLLNGGDWQEWILHCVISVCLIWITNEIINR